MAQAICETVALACEAEQEISFLQIGQVFLISFIFILSDMGVTPLVIYRNKKIKKQK